MVHGPREAIVMRHSRICTKWNTNFVSVTRGNNQTNTSWDMETSSCSAQAAPWVHALGKLNTRLHVKGRFPAKRRHGWRVQKVSDAT